MNAMLNLDFASINSEFSQNFALKGVLAEQFIAQHLAYFKPTRSPRLNYWLRDKGSNKGEVDFLMQIKNSVTPIEVKAKKSGQLRSLHYFIKEKKLPLAIKFSLDPLAFEDVHFTINEQKLRYRLLNLPHYLVEKTHEIIDDGVLPEVIHQKQNAQ